MDPTQPNRIELERHQADFIQAKEQYTALFGGIGNGKTFAACLKGIQLSARYPNNLGLVGRFTYPELRDSTREEYLHVLGMLYPPKAYKINKTEGSVTLWNKSATIFRHLEDSRKLLGPNLGWFYIDQAEEVDEDVFSTLQGRLRRPRIGELSGMITGNPHGHDWVYHKFGMQYGWNDQNRQTNYAHSSNYRMITAPTHSNADNLPPNYVSQLQESYSKEWFNRYVLGSWDGWAGMIFDVSKIGSYDRLPDIEMIFTGCDPAISKEKEACDTAFSTIGVGKDGYYYDLETIAEHWTFLETLEQIRAIQERFKGYKVRHYLGVENTAYQESLREAAERDFPELEVHGIAADRDKFRRARSVSHIIQQGLFRSNNKELLADMSAFDPDARGKLRKDRIDALVHALHMVQLYAPINRPMVTVQDQFKGMDSHQAWFKQTQDYARHQLEGVDNVDEYSPSTGGDPDYY